jgi:hypothetical protein
MIHHKDDKSLQWLLIINAIIQLGLDSDLYFLDSTPTS